MAAQDGFASGMQMGLGMFNAMQNASYQQQLMTNAQENQQLRRQEVAIQQQKYIADQARKAEEQDNFVLTNPDAFPQNVRLEAINRMNRRLAGDNARPITQLAADAFDADLRGFPDRLKGANNQEGMKSIFAEMEAKAHENPLFLQAWKIRKPVFEQVMQQQSYYDSLTELTGSLMSDDKRRKLVERADPKVLNKILEDKDYQSMFIQRQVEQNLQTYLSGEENFSGAKLRDTLAMARKIGMKLGVDGEKLVKEHDTYMSYNQSAEQLTLVRQNMTPLFDAVKASPDTREVISVSGKVDPAAFAHPKPGSPLGGLIYAKEHIDAAEKRNSVMESYFQKNPAIAQQIQELGGQAITRTTQIDRQVQDLTRQRDLVENDKLHPNRDMVMNLYDRQIQALKREGNIWKPFAEYQQNPTITSLANILKAESTLDRSLKEVSNLRDTTKTASDRNSDRVTNLQYQEANGKKATSWGTMMLLEEIAKNPKADDEQRMGMAARIAEQAGQKYGVPADPNEMIKRVVAQRTKAEDDTKLKLDSTEAARFSLLQQGERSLQEYKNAVTNADGSYNYSALSTQELRLPYSDGRTLDTLIMNPQTGEMRLESGAAVTPNEWTQKAQQMKALFLDNPATIDTKFKRATEHFANMQNLMDPQKKLRARTEVAPPRSRAEILEGQSNEQRKNERVIEKMNQKGAMEDFDKFRKAHPKLSQEEAFQKWAAQ